MHVITLAWLSRMLGMAEMECICIYQTATMKLICEVTRSEEPSILLISTFKFNFDSCIINGKQTTLLINYKLS